MIINYFEIDDIMHRFNVIFYLVCLFGFTSVRVIHVKNQDRLHKRSEANNSQNRTLLMPLSQPILQPLHSTSHKGCSPPVGI